MCIAQTAKRKRIQARNGYVHLPKIGRPKYRKMDEGKAKRREAAKVAKIKLMQTRKKR